MIFSAWPIIFSIDNDILQLTKYATNIILDLTHNIISFVFLKMSKKKSWAVQFKEFRVFAECVLDYLRSQVVLIFYVTGCDQWLLITCTLHWSHFLTQTHLSSQVLLISHDNHNVHTEIGHVYACLGNERSLCLEDRHRQRLGGRCASSGADQFSKDLFSYLVFFSSNFTWFFFQPLLPCNL